MKKLLTLAALMAIFASCEPTGGATSIPSDSTVVVDTVNAKLDSVEANKYAVAGNDTTVASLKEAKAETLETVK